MVYMNNKKIYICLTKLIFPLIMLMILCSCGMGSKSPAPQQQSTQSQEESEKIPDQLKKIEESIEKIFKDLNGPAVAIKQEEGKKEGQQSKSDKGDQKQDTKNQESEKGKEGQGEKGESEKQGEEKQKEPAQPPAAEDPWQKINTDVNELHYQWNAYTPMAAKAGANRTQMDNFSNALNNLTNTINTKKLNDVLLAASYTYGCLPEFYYLYKTKSSPEIKKIRHFVRNSMLNGMNGNWAQADADVNNLKTSWSVYKNMAQQEQKDNASKLDFAIYEYEKVVKEKNQQLVDIKGRVALADVQELEKSMEEGQKK